MALWFLLTLVAVGLVAGVVAQSVLPELSVPGSVVLGLVGSFLGGVMAWLFIDTPFGLLFAVLGAGALLYTRNRFLAYR